MEATTAERLFCIEYGAPQRHNVFRMTASVVVPATDEALTYLQVHCPEVLDKTAAPRIYPVQHVVRDWPLDKCEIVEQENDETIPSDT
jgi:hypothetical protein